MYESVFIGDTAETYGSSSETILAAYSVGFHNSFDSWSGSVNSGFILPSKPSVLCVTLTGTEYFETSYYDFLSNSAVETIIPDSSAGQFQSFSWSRKFQLEQKVPGGAESSRWSRF